MKLERELKEVFDFYSQGEGNKTITFDQLAEITDKANLQLSDEELKDYLKQIDDSNTEKIPYKSFVELFDKKIYVDVPK